MYVADLLPEELFNRPVHYLYDTPQGYVTAAIRLQLIDEQLIKDLHSGRTNDLPAVLGSHGVRYILLRRDIAWKTTIPDRHIVSPDLIAGELQRTTGLTFLRTFGQLDLYAIATPLVRGPLYVVPETSVHTTAQSDPVTVIQSAKAGTVLVPSQAPSCSVVKGGPVTPPTLQILHQGLNGYTIRVTTSQAPTLLVLNQSYHPGWEARLVSDGTQNGTGCAGSALPHLVGAGFANAWWVTRSGTNIVHISFADQRVVDVGDIVSTVTVAAAALILLASLIKFGTDRLDRSGRAKECETRV
jgi:hypothetical protein